MVRGKNQRLPLLISQRIESGGRAGHLAYGAWNEAEDVLGSATGCEIGLLDRHSQERPIHNRRALGRALRRAAGRTRRLPATKRGPSTGGSEHIFFMARTPWDLPLLERLRSLRRRALTLSVWLPEIWPSELADPRLKFEAYAMVDHVFLGIEEAVEPFASVAPEPEVHVLPPAVDVLRFAPADPFSPRGIAVLGIGRRDGRQHEEILEWASNHKALYLYDTVRGRAVNWSEHRDALANTYQHANVAICNFAKHDVPAVTEGLRALPGRLFEGLAAGSILVGRPPDEETQRQVIGETVVEPLDGSRNELKDLLDRFTDPDEAHAIRTRNLALACRGQDWAHRWNVALQAVGLPVPFGLQDRLDDLAKRALEYDELTESS